MKDGRCTPVVVLFLAALLSVAPSGCDRSGEHDRELNAQEGFVLNGAWFAWNDARQAYVRLDLSGSPGEKHAIQHISVDGGTRISTVTPDAARLVVMSPEAREVSVLGSDGAVEGRYDLGQPFNARSMSEDGRFLVAYTSAGQSVIGGTAVGENLLSVVDLAADPGDDNPSSMTVGSYGGARLGVDLSPEFFVAGAAHRLAVIRSQGHVALLDVLHLEDPVIGVPLVLPGDPVDLQPREARFAFDESGEGALWVFLTAPGSGDVITLRIVRDVRPDASATALRANLNQHAVGGWVREVLPVRDSEGQLYVVALSESSRLLSMIDVGTGSATNFQLDQAYQRIESYELEVSKGGVEPHVLLSLSGSDRFGLLALDDVATRGVKALDTRVLRTNYGFLLPIPGQPRLVSFDDSDNHLTFVRLDREAAEDSVAFSGVILDHSFDGDAGHLLLLVSSDGGARSLVSIDMDTGAIAELAVGPFARELHLLPDSGRILIEHSSSGGLLTLVDPERFSVEEAEQIVGFLLEGLLDGQEVTR